MGAGLRDIGVAQQQRGMADYYMLVYMKAIQVTVDEALLERLDGDDEVKRDGRSAVLRRAAELYLRQRTAREVAEAYRRAYGKGDTLGTEFEGWEHEGSWRLE